MVELFENQKADENRQSSKGNQLKWQSDRIWYKADYAGYEGLAEYMVSGLLRFSNLLPEEYVAYQTEEITYKKARYLGCSSVNFLPDGWQMYTLERLFQNCYGESLYRQMYRLDGIEERLKFLVEQTERMTGLSDFGPYLCKLLTLDAFFLNEDRHTHNIAVLRDSNGQFHECPIFDHGAALLSDTTMDYPIGSDIFDCIASAKSKTVSQNFDEQLDAAEALYGRQIWFSHKRKDMLALLEQEPYYSPEIKERVAQILSEQMRKYQFMFH